MRATKGTTSVNPGVEKGYALDFTSAVRYVATRLEGAAGALSVSELTTDYHHIVSSDLSRIRSHHHLPTDDAAKQFLIERALAALGSQVSIVDGSARKANPSTPWTYEGKSVVLYENPHAELRDPFNPMSGDFATNIRRSNRKDTMDELRESMREFNWLPELPAITDERGVVLMGHRRLAVAAELGIKPELKVIQFGSGDEADARRFKLAIASNIGSKPFTPEERQRIAEYLYSDKGWTMASIGQALNVSKKTISLDLAEVVTSGNNPPDRPKGGRPKTTRRVERIHSNKGKRKWVTLERRQEAQEFAYQRHIADDHPTQTRIAAEINEIFRPGEPIDGTQAWTLVRNQQLTIEDELRAGMPIPNEWLAPGEKLCPACYGTGRVGSQDA